MKKIALKNATRGTAFDYAGQSWILLENDDGRALCLSKDIIETRAFDEGNCNNFAVASSKEYLNGAYLDNLLEDVNGPNAFLTTELDLTTDDGLKDYGTCTVTIFLLTVDQYRRNRDVIPNADDWWWLSTAFSTKSNGYESLARHVNSDGTLNWNIAYNGYHGLRPACYLDSDLLISIEDDEATDDVTPEHAGEIIAALAEQFGVIFVCPDGENSWYWDSPINPSSQFETFVSQELPDWVDAHYPTLPSREGRAVAGLSMGGHGALWTAVRHKDRFGAVGSVSGGVDNRPFPDSWEMKAQLGEERENQARWDAHTVINAVDSLRDGELAIFVDCGYDDFFYGVNVALHEKLLRQGVGHDFLTRPGAHTGEYWGSSLPHQLLFFRSYFDRAGK